MTGRDAAALCGLLRPRVVVPVHYEGWEHFRQDRAAAEQELARAPDAIARSVQWLPLGEAHTIGL